MGIAQLREQAMRLSSSDRAALAHELLQSLAPVDPDASADGIERAQLEEVRQRYEAYKRGEIEFVDGFDVIDELQRQFTPSPK